MYRHLNINGQQSFELADPLRTGGTAQCLVSRNVALW